MNLKENTPDYQSESIQDTQNIARTAFDSSVSSSGSGAIAPSSPISMPELPIGHSHSAMSHFMTPKTIAAMVGVWLLIIISVSTFVHNKPKPSLSRANVPGPAALVTPLNPEEEQKNDIKLINDRLGEYYDRFGIYPSISQINSEEFRRADPSFIKIGRKTYTDPLGSNINFAAKPTKGQYHYVPLPEGCNSSSVMCRSYTVGATLASGQLYNLQGSE